ncbi:DUF4863 family protein [Streptomyces aureoverticillatus]|nr:DUF4863 family protein [Streptomyces aureoverticillatus]
MAQPSADKHYFSIPAVCMDSVERYRGQYHAHRCSGCGHCTATVAGFTAEGPCGPWDPGSVT